MQSSPPKPRLRPLWLACLVFSTFASNLTAATYESTSLKPPAPQREFRALWIATVGNIDWPSTNNLSTAQQKAELSAVFDRASELGLNVVIFQVRPGCDSLYASTIEPWSEYLTGVMGKAPEPFYDPLAFAVQEAHRRGLELHAWLNPYRARHASAKSPIAPSHISKTRPQFVRQYGRSLWLDPSEPAVQDYSLGVIADIVRRYDVDGIHIDDYFYPYPERDSAGREIPFPDDTSWRRYQTHGKLGREDWRRENVNSFVRRAYQSIKTAKPWVKFGVSPFGIWRPGSPSQIKGFDAYDKLYADSRKWLASGWCDYFAPQLYWPIDPPEQSFPVLLRWWASQNQADRLLAPGLDATRTLRHWPATEIVNQVRWTRKLLSPPGQIYWNARSLMRNGALDAEIKRELYAQPALVPPCPWLGKTSPPQPQLKAAANAGTLHLTWNLPQPARVSFWVVQFRNGSSWTTRILPGTRSSLDLIGPPPSAVSVTAVNRLGIAGRPATFRLKSAG